jgi:hypothetical protein
MSPDGGYRLDWVTDQLAVGQAPMSRDHLEALKQAGVDAILNLCAEYCDLHEIEAESGFQVYYLPIPDEEAPDMAEMEKALAWLDEAIYLDKKVLIHCRHGIGRTGTVLNAYLLRRGLGHKMAGRTIKGLKSKPANFDQWWTIRKYGRKEGRLTVREPSLEMRHLVDLSPFFADYRALVAQAEDFLSLEGKQDQGRCGRDHLLCCRTPVRMHLVEAVHVAHKINQELDSVTRLQVIDRAVPVARAETRAEAEMAELSSGAEVCLSDAGELCPLSELGECLLFDYRPLQCRTHGLPEEVDAELWAEVLAPGLEKTSRDLFFAFTSTFARDTLPVFTLPDVASGRYVQTFFHHMLAMRNGA